MLNKWVGMGRIVAAPELRRTDNGTAVLTFTVAVERDYKDASGVRPVDFIDCVAWKQKAEFIAQYFGKGSMIAVSGALNKRAYTTQNGEKRHVVEVVVDGAYFTGEAKKEQSAPREEFAGYATLDDMDDCPF